MSGKPPTHAALLEPEERVLSTLNRDGTRRWLRPRVSPGVFLTARRITAYVLIAIFTVIPYIYINGKPAMLLDIAAREFTLFGTTFLPTDTILLALFMVGLIVSIFLITALFGRVWCGWACPQTVYLEFLYRPIERLFEGAPGRGGSAGRRSTGPRKLAKYAVYLLVSMFLAHTFLAYFVGIEQLATWVTGSPLDHPIGFVVMIVTTALMMFDFCFFREQTCIVACPYGRFQSVMLDRNSLIVSYDPGRGEPRAKPGKRRAKGGTSLDVLQYKHGDCIDCGLCVDTCPTGIDIRDGLQMECVGCAQCIDACDNVMDKVGSPRGLIRYSSQARIDGQHSGMLRPRVIIYPLILLIIGTLFGVTLSGKSTADVTVLRRVGSPYAVLPDGRITNTVQLKIANRLDVDAAYLVELLDAPDCELQVSENPLAVKAGQARSEAFRIVTERSAFTGGRREVTLRVSDGDTFSEELAYKLLGPTGAAPQPDKTKGAGG